MLMYDVYEITLMYLLMLCISSLSMTFFVFLRYLYLDVFFRYKRTIADTCMLSFVSSFVFSMTCREDVLLMHLMLPISIVLGYGLLLHNITLHISCCLPSFWRCVCCVLL